MATKGLVIEFPKKENPGRGREKEERRKNPSEGSLPQATQDVKPLRRWQAEALPIALDALRSGVKGVIAAVMGAGKSRLAGEVVRAMEDERFIVATPKRLLVEQLHRTLEQILGEPVGMWYTQAKDIRRVTVTTYRSLGQLVDDWLAKGLGKVYLIADEAHRTETELIKDAVGRLPLAGRLGLTATPFLASQYDAIELFDKILYEYGPEQAYKDGVVVRPRVYPLHEASPIDPIISMMQAYLEDTRWGVVNATGVEDAQAYAAHLTKHGIPAEAVTGETPRDEREALFQAHQEGSVHVLVHVHVLSEGADLPWIRWMGLRRHVKSRVRFVQEVGRGLRSWPGKDCCVYLDPGGLWKTFRLTYDAVLGWAPVRERTISKEEIGPGGTGHPKVVTPLPLPPEDIYLGHLLQSLPPILCDNDRDPVLLTPKLWQLDDVTEKQYRFIRSLVDGRALKKLRNHEAAEWIRHLVFDLGGPWTKGAAMVLIELLLRISRWPDERVPLPSIMIPPTDVRPPKNMREGDRYYFAVAVKRAKGGSGYQAVRVLVDKYGRRVAHRAGLIDEDWRGVAKTIVANAKAMAKELGIPETHLWLVNDGLSRYATMPAVPKNGPEYARLWGLAWRMWNQVFRPKR